MSFPAKYPSPSSFASSWHQFSTRAQRCKQKPVGLKDSRRHRQGHFDLQNGAGTARQVENREQPLLQGLPDVVPRVPGLFLGSCVQLRPRTTPHEPVTRDFACYLVTLRVGADDLSYGQFTIPKTVLCLFEVGDA